MNVLIACDSFKGSLTTLEAALLISEGVHEVFPDARTTIVPIADGGEGTVDALAGALGGELVECAALDPLGRERRSHYGILPDGTAVVEMAAASGLPLLTEGERNPARTTSYGTGQLVLNALDRGCRSMVMGIGGSATNDGGMGMMQALGARLLDSSGRELGFGGLELNRLEKVDISCFDNRLKSCSFTVACDVTNPLCGPNGASAVYGPQKGATPDMVRVLDLALRNLSDVIKRDLGFDVADIPGAGAAGGMGAGLLAFCGASMRPGVELVMEVCGFESKVCDADLVITGEGSIDASSACGKAPVGVAAAAKRYGVPVLAISAQLGEGYETIYSAGVDAAAACVNRVMGLDEAINGTHALLRQCAAGAMRIIKIGMEMRT